MEPKQEKKKRARQQWAASADSLQNTSAGLPKIEREEEEEKGRNTKEKAKVEK
ncbi:MAG: hypothetical protein AAGJ35_14140 [Myxococcota bacterium]